jgi:hypothetical protein
MTTRFLCATPGCREATKHVLCWAHWQQVPRSMHRQSDDDIRAWAKNRQPVLATAPVRPFNETAEKDL